ncbi:amino acid adenylation domain-containing protein, partial [Streptomyces sp. NPDC059604]|uniref:amino acid adenylation domain-containing protein n=1 Tax=Streptomyces sp. NPDC059604 TaxID=3346881 RepID=UPI0036C1C417
MVVRAEDPAYVIYTSGSTGVPKGVVVTHSGIGAMVAQAKKYGYGPGSTVLQFVSPSFDISFWDLCSALLTGGCLLVPTGDETVPGPALEALMAEHAPTHAVIPPAVLKTLSQEAMASVHTLFAAGEASDAELADRWSRGRRLLNGYGPTETTVCATIGERTSGGSVPPIGRPIYDTQVYVLDDRLHLTPPGVPGELYISGAGLARGYLGRPDLTAERFVASPFGAPGSRMYRTGDVVRWNADGELEYLARADDQVKVRGFRIELGEIEAELVRHPAVRHASVVVREDTPGDKRLVGYVVPRTPEPGNRDATGEDKQVDDWQSIYESMYADLPPAPFGEDFSGWHSSYDGQPIPVEEMRAWRAEAVDRVRELAPRRVLEIGVGSGLILSRLAPHTEEYWATDFSPSVIDRLRAEIVERPDLADRITLRCRAAHELDGLPEGHFDTVVINSVVQYFPSADYLADVLRAVGRLVAPGGSVFIGDVRNLRLLNTMRTEIQLGAADADADAATLRRAVEQDLARENELLVDPDYFTALTRTLPEWAAAEIRLKSGTGRNELTRYRYDVVLRAHTEAPADEDGGTVLRWGSGISGEADLVARLADATAEPLRVIGVPNARVAAQFAAAAALHVDGDRARARERLRAPLGDAVEPAHWEELGERFGRRVVVSWSALGDDLFDAAFVDRAQDRPGEPVAPVRPQATAGVEHAAGGQKAWTNTPAATDRPGVAAKELQQHLRERLPDYMVPSAFVALEALPLTPNGKLDRKALPVPDAGPSLTGRPPRTPQEEILCGLFAEVLGLPAVGVDDSFFDLGGHSLLATRLLSRIRSVLGAELEVRQLFEAPTAARLAGVLLGSGRARAALRRAERPDRVPMSFAQRRLWFLHRLEGPSATYNMPLTLRLTGTPDVEALRLALGDLVVRQETLRTVFPDVDGTAHQLVLDAASATPELRIAHVGADETHSALTEAARHAFDLSAEPPLRTHLFVVDPRDGAPREHVLLLVLHHVAADGWSMAPLARDLATAYAARCTGREPQWSGLPVQYTDYTLWERDLLGDEGDPDSLISRQLHYWSGALAGLPERLDLPTDRPRPAVASHAGDVLDFSVEPELHRALQELTRERGASLFMVLQAGLGALLTRLGAGTDVPLGALVAGRNDEAVEELVGFFVNTLVTRVDTAGNPTFGELLDRVRETDLAAYAHQDVPFEHLVERLNPVRSAAHHPLFQVMLALQNAPEVAFELPGLQARVERIDTGTSRFDLTFSVSERHTDSGTAAGIDGFVEYRTDLYDRATVRTLVDRWLRLLAAAVADPGRRIGELPVLREEEYVTTLAAAEGTRSGVRAMTLPGLYEEQARRTPGRTALVCGRTRLTYRELHRDANALAHELIGRGVGPETVVALSMPRSADLVVALLAVAKAGGAYLPVDPEYPAERIALMLDDAAPHLVLTTEAVAARLPGQAPRMILSDAILAGVRSSRPATDPTDTDRQQPLRLDHPAYLIYTSGSTGVPKGALVTHRGLAALATTQQERFGLGEDSRVLQFASASFDAMVMELLMALTTGGALVVPREGGLLAGDELAGTLTAERITHALVPPSVLRHLPDTGGLLPGTLIVGGEACPPDLAARWSTGRNLVNAYGPTEATACVATSDPVSGGGAPPLGRPGADTRLRVLGSALEAVPNGVIGELYVAGEGLARGYLGRAGLTAERFVADPYGVPGERMYRTGDLVRRDAEGILEFVGRADDQVKIRGFRIEPGEIEAALAAHPGVAQAAVTVHEDASRGRHLAAYAVASDGGILDAHELRRYLNGALPRHMVPAAVDVLPAFPLMPNGKLDRKALPEPRYGANTPVHDSGSAQEDVLCTLFADVLGVPRVGADSSFFDLGGHSLLATQLVSRVRSVFGAELTVRHLFERPTPAGLAAFLMTSGRPRTALAPMRRPQEVPLSYAQRRLWFLHRLEGPSPTYNIPLVWRLTGEPDRDAIARALRDVVVRHESLRTLFPLDDGTPRQEILSAEAARPPLRTTRTTAAELPSALAAAARYGFDLSGELPLRSELFDLGEGEYVLLVLMHHIAADGWSMAPLARDLAAAYAARCAGRAPEWQPLPVQYADYTLWQRELLGDPADPDSLMGEQVDYWRKTLSGLPEQLALPYDRPRPAVASHRGDGVLFDLDGELHSRLAALARSTGSSLYMVLQAGLAALLTRLGAGTDIPLGGAIAGRTDEATENLVGFFVNSLVLRVDTSGDPTFSELVGRVRETDLAAYAHQDVPFEHLVEELNPTRSAGHHPLFQVMLALQNAPSDVFELAGLKVVQDSTRTGTSRFDLFFSLTELESEDAQHAGLTGFVEYSTDLFDHGTVQALVERWLHLLGRMAETPQSRLGSFELLNGDERRRLMTVGTGPGTPAPELPLTELFRAQAARTPGAPALVCGETVLSYTEVNAAANRLAHRLRRAGIGTEDVVGLAVTRSAEAIVALLAVLKAGAAYLPLDPRRPAAQLRQMRDATGMKLLLCDRASTIPEQLQDLEPLLVTPADLTPGAGEHGDDADLPVRVFPHQLAYIMYTSGSTGVPKAIAVTHADVAALAQDPALRFANERVLLHSPLAFDASTYELWVPLLTGGQVVVAPEGRVDAEVLRRVIVEHGVTSLWMTAGLFGVVMDEAADCLTGVRQVLAGGDAVPPAAVRRLAEVCPDAVFVNGYGPTETTTFATRHVLGAPHAVAHTVPIGRPLAGKRVYVLDEQLRLVPPGVAGELYVAGAGLARGYLDRPALTSERFLADPFGAPGDRMYRTGDRVRWNGDNDLEFVGRVDDQVKVRGFRVEPGEVEAALGRHPGVGRSVVVVREDVPGDKRLVGYVVPAGVSGVVRDVAAEVEQVGEWESLYESLYAGEGRDAEFGEDFS